MGVEVHDVEGVCACSAELRSSSTGSSNWVVGAFLNGNCAGVVEAGEGAVLQREERGGSAEREAESGKKDLTDNPRGETESTDVELELQREMLVTGRKGVGVGIVVVVLAIGVDGKVKDGSFDVEELNTLTAIVSASASNSMSNLWRFQPQKRKRNTRSKQKLQHSLQSHKQSCRTKGCRACETFESLEKMTSFTTKKITENNQNNQNQTNKSKSKKACLVDMQSNQPGHQLYLRCVMFCCCSLLLPSFGRKKKKKEKKN